MLGPRRSWARAAAPGRWWRAWPSAEPRRSEWPTESFARAQQLAIDFGAPVRAIPWDQRHEALDGASLLVNATNQGMVGEPPLDLSLDRLPKRALVSDIVYVPLETPLLKAARQRGNPTVNGLGMLLHQARPAFKAWFGVLPEVTPELRRLLEATI